MNFIFLSLAGFSVKRPNVSLDQWARAKYKFPRKDTFVCVYFVKNTFYLHTEYRDTCSTLQHIS